MGYHDRTIAGHGYEKEGRGLSNLENAATALTCALIYVYLRSRVFLEKI